MPLLKLPFMLLAALLAALALAACGSTTLDTAKVEDEVQELAEDEDIEVDSVSCPEDVEAQEGDEFECDVETEDGVEIEAEVEQRSDDGDVRVRISSAEIAKAQGGGEGGDTGGETTTPDTGGDTGGAAGGEDAALVEQAIRSFVTAARDGDAETFCGQQSDPRLARRYGGIEECVGSEEATTPAPSIPSGDDIDVRIQSLEGDRATVTVDAGRGSTSTYEMVNEGGEGGWAIESIDGE